MDFISFLEKNTQTQLTILENIYISKKSWNLEELSALTNSDKRSILNHCEHIQELSKGHFNKETRNYSYSGTSIDYQKLILAILDHSSVFQLVHTLCLQSQVDLTEFSKSRNISESFLRRHLTRINQLLEKYRIQIKTAKGHIFIRGEETQIRYLIYLILWQSYRGVEWPFKGVDFHQVFLVIEKSFQLINQRPNKIKMMEWCFIVAITKLRADQENRIQKEILPSFTDQLWLAFEEIASELSIGFNRLSLTTSEIEFLFLWLQTRTSFYLNDHFLDKATKIHLKEDTPIKQFQNNFYRYLYSIGFKSSQINSKKRLLNSTLFANGMTGYLFPEFSIIKHDISTFIEKNYPTFNREINRLSQHFKNQSQTLAWVHPWNLAEAFMIVASPTYFDKEIKIKFESDFPLSIELTYMEMLQEQLRIYLNVLFTNDFLYKPDLIIRTTDIPLKTVTYEESIPTLTISTEMSSEQIYLLSQKIQKIVNR